MGFWAARPVVMAKHRARIDRDHKPLLKLARKLARQSEFVLDGPDYSKLSREAPHAELDAWYRKKSLALTHEEPLTEELYSATYALISRATLGNTTKEHKVLLPIMKEVIALAAGFDIAELFPSIKLLQKISGLRRRVICLHQQADRILEDIIHEHKVANSMKTDESEKQEDLIDVLLKLQEDGLEIPLTTDNIKSVLVVSFLLFSSCLFCILSYAHGIQLISYEIL